LPHSELDAVFFVTKSARPLSLVVPRDAGRGRLETAAYVGGKARQGAAAVVRTREKNIDLTRFEPLDEAAHRFVTAAPHLAEYFAHLRLDGVEVRGPTPEHAGPFALENVAAFADDADHCAFL
jgi:hypothetical protein